MMPSACDTLPNETSQEIVSSKSKQQQQQKDKKTDAKQNGHENGNLSDETTIDKNGDKDCKADATSTDKTKNDQELIFIHDTGFTIKVAAPGIETFDLQVSSMELVQEIHHLLMDREDTCSRTCFSLSLNGNTLDNFTELKSIDGFKEGAIIKVVEEPYTVREARIHIRHIRDLLKSLDPADAYNGQECNSLSYLNVIAQGIDILDNSKKKGNRPDIVDCTPPNHILPGNHDLPLSALQPIAKEQKGPQALKILTTSGWNAPPGTRKLHGDLIYIYVVTMEDKHFHITSSTKGFYVNLSTNEEFNPKPATPFVIYHSLIDLLAYLSPAFKKNYALIQKKRHQKHPFERVATPYQVYSWTAPKLEHSIDSIRAEDSFASKLGYEEHLPGQTRDWNEELQTTRELPRKTLPERLIRERAIFKVHSDFVVAATRGAMAVIDGNVLAINPSEDQKMQMFIWHNIFFSLGFDIRDHYKELGGDHAAFVAPNNDLQGVKAYASVDVEGLYTLGTVVIDYRGFRVTAQSIIPGILEREQEQSVVYGSIDFGKTVITSEKYFDLLGKAGKVLKILPHKVYDHNDELAELISSVECKGIIGNDGRHYILDLLRTFPQDVNYYQLPIEEYSKELVEEGYPKKFKHNLCCLRHELIDTFFEYRYMSFIKNNALQIKALGLEGLKRIKDENGNDDEKTIKSIKSSKQESAETNNDEANDELSLLSNLMQDYKFKDFDEELRKIETKILSTKEGEDLLNNAPKDIVKASAKLVASLKEDEFYIRFNPNAFSPVVRHDETDKEYFNRQKELIKDAAKFLVTFQIPAFVSDCLQNALSPIDGFALSDALHNRGINIRYLGKVAEKLSQFKRLEYLHSISVKELICRSAKHLFANYIQNVDSVNLASAVNLFLNCFLSACKNVSVFNVVDSHQSSNVHQQAGKKKNRKRNKHHISTDNDITEWATLTPKSFLDKLKEDLQQHYSFTLKGSSIEEVADIYKLNKITVLRSFCLKTGVQILLRDYKFDQEHNPTFSEDDILNIFPVVKHIQPRATDALNFFSTGQTKIQQGQFKEGYELISEALNLLNNVYGALHPEITQCLRMLARLNYIMGDFAEAMACQQKAVLMSEKVNGIDHSMTITEYTHLALYCFANQQVTVALKLLYRARYLLLLNSSENHPDMAVIDSNIGLILHSVGEYEMSIQFLKSALNLNIFYYGNNSLKVAVSYDLVARSQSCLGDFRSALHNEKETYSIYKQQLGEKHEKSIESSESLRHLTQQAVVLQKRMNELSKGKNASVPSLQIQPPSLNSVLQTLNVINGIIHIQFNASNLSILKESSLSANDESTSNKKMIEDTALD